MPQATKARIPGPMFGMAAVFWVASEMSRRSWIALPTVRNLKGVDVFGTSAGPNGSKFVEIQVKAAQGGRFWLLGPMKRDDIPNRETLFFVFVRPQLPMADSPLEGLVVPSKAVFEQAKQQDNEKFQFCWYPPKETGMFLNRWDLLG